MRKRYATTSRLVGRSVPCLCDPHLFSFFEKQIARQVTRRVEVMAISPVTVTVSYKRPYVVAVITSMKYRYIITTVANIVGLRFPALIFATITTTTYPFTNPPRLPARNTNMLTHHHVLAACNPEGTFFSCSSLRALPSPHPLPTPLPNAPCSNRFNMMSASIKLRLCAPTMSIHRRTE